MLRYLHPRWIALHAFVLAASAAMIYAGRWQWRVAKAHHGDIRNYAYAVQWYVFVAFAIVLWIKVIRDARERAAPTGLQSRPDGQPPAAENGQAATYRGYAMPQAASITVDDPELARYNTYLTALAEQTAAQATPTDAGGGPVRTEGRT